MNLAQAKTRVTVCRFIGFTIMFTTAVAFVLSILNSLFAGLDGDTTPFAELSQSIQRGIYYLYQNSQQISFMWEIAPIIEPRNLNSTGNYYFLLIIFSHMIGRIFWQYANDLSARIKDTLKRVEGLNWENDLRRKSGVPTTDKVDILQINIELESKDQWYKKPFGLVVVGVTITLIVQLINLSFELL